MTPNIVVTLESARRAGNHYTSNCINLKNLPKLSYIYISINT